VRVALVLALALLTGACATGESALTAAAPPPDTGLWKFEKRTDPSTGGPMTTAYLSVNTLDSWGHLHSVTLQLMCWREPVVRVAFNIKVGSNRSAALIWRFDDRTGREATVRFLSDYKTVMIEDQAEVAAFVEELAASERLHLTISSLIVGRTAVKFAVKGAPHAIAQAYAECPLPQKKKRVGV
jgi:hypothetical protein